jgi:hypothetical protein
MPPSRNVLLYTTRSDIAQSIIRASMNSHHPFTICGLNHPAMERIREFSISSVQFLADVPDAVLIDLVIADHKDVDEETKKLLIHDQVTSCTTRYVTLDPSIFENLRDPETLLGLVEDTLVGYVAYWEGQGWGTVSVS